MGAEILPSSVSTLVEREADNSRRIAELKAQLDKLESENKRIVDALALLKELGAVPNYALIEPAAPKTLPEMIFATIREKGALPGGDIIEHIRAEWRDDMKSDHVRPTLWRLVQAGRLKKRGDRYDLP